MLIKLIRDFLARRERSAFNAEQIARLLHVNRKVHAEPARADVEAALRRLTADGHVSVVVDPDTKVEHFQATPLGIAANEAAPA